MAGAAQVKPSPEGVPGGVTDPHAVRGENVTFAGAGGTRVNGYLATPANSAEDTSRPAIVVIHEAGGLGEHIRDVTNRFAYLGYTALGVDLYTREGGPPSDDVGARMERLFSMPDERTLGVRGGRCEIAVYGRVRGACKGHVLAANGARVGNRTRHALRARSHLSRFRHLQNRLRVGASGSREHDREEANHNREIEPHLARTADSDQHLAQALNLVGERVHAGHGVQPGGHHGQGYSALEAKNRGIITS